MTEKIKSRGVAVVKKDAIKPYHLDNINQMAGMATLLKGHIIKQGLFTNISGKNYAHVDGWAYAGGLMGIFPKVIKVENLSVDKEIKWKADVELIRVKDDKIVGFGTAICSNVEGKKKGFDEYAVLSMAQTRAIGKAYRNLVGWVMQLAGMESTPAEEMPTNPVVVKGKDMTTAQKFQQAKTMIKALPTIASVKKAISQIKGSDLYDDLQKDALIKELVVRENELTK